MLEYFLWRQDVDFALLQEVKHKTIDTIQHYTAYGNAGTNNRGTAVLARMVLPVTNFNLWAPRFLYIGQAFRYSPGNAFYIFNQQIYFII